MASPSLTISNFNVLKRYTDDKFIRQNNQYSAGFTTNAITEATPGSGVSINSPLNVLAGLTVTGDATYIQTLDTIVSDPNICINAGYTVPGVVKTGIVSNINPLALQDTTSQFNSDLTIDTVGSATFATSDIISVSGTVDNNGLYEVDTHIGTTLTVRGITGTPTVEVFTRETVSDETVVGTITKVTISHLSTNATGGWEYATGSTTGLVYNGVGSDTITLQNVYDNGEMIVLGTNGVLIKDNGTPIAGDLFAIKNDAETSTFFSVDTGGAMTTILDINSNATVSATTDSLFNVLQTPVATIGEKAFKFRSDTSDNSVLIALCNGNASASGHTGLKLQTDTTACTGNGGNQYITYESCNIGGWTIGRQKSTNTYRWNYLASTPLALTDDINTKMYLDTSGNLHAVGNGDFSNIVLQTVPNDNTEVNLLTWNASSKNVEYRTVSSLPVVNPFDQTLNIDDDVEFNSVDINSHMQLTAAEFLYEFAPTTVTTLGAKEFRFKSNSSDNTSILSVQNQNAGAATHAAVKIQTDSSACTGNGGNQCVFYDSCSVGGWTVGRQKSTNTFRWNYNATTTSYLAADANTRMFLDTSGNLNIDGGLTCTTVNTGQGAHELYFMDQPVGQANTVIFDQVSINAGHTITSGAVDGITNIEQFPLTTVSDRLFTFKSESQNVAYLSMANKSINATAHAAVRVETDAFAGGTGGNQFMALVNHTANPWSIGRKLSDNTIRFNLSTTSTIDPLVTDANTKLLLDSAGKLTLTSLSVNNDNIVITSVNDSTTLLSQTPAVTTGVKIMSFASETSDVGVIFDVQNRANSATGHASIRILTDSVTCNGTGGNQSILFEHCGNSKWAIGHQSSTQTFRWNFGINQEYLTNDADTRMFLDTSGNLDIDGVYSVGGTQVVGARLAGVADASAATAIGITNSTSGTTDGTVVDTSTNVTGVDGTLSNAASKADVDARLIDINNNIAELAVNQNALISDVASIRSALNTLLARIRSTTGHGLIS